MPFGCEEHGDAVGDTGGHVELMSLKTQMMMAPAGHWCVRGRSSPLCCHSGGSLKRKREEVFTASMRSQRGLCAVSLLVRSQRGGAF